MMMKMSFLALAFVTHKFKHESGRVTEETSPCDRPGPAQ